MNRQEALAWLVGTVVGWPIVLPKTPLAADGWKWVFVRGRTYLFPIEHNYKAISEQDWLAAIENKARGEA